VLFRKHSHKGVTFMGKGFHSKGVRDCHACYVGAVVESGCVELKGNSVRLIKPLRREPRFLAEP